MKYISINKGLDDKISGEWGVEPDDDYGVKIIRTANFTNLGIIDFSNIVLRKIESKKIEQKKLISGDVIIEKSGGSPTQPVGRVVYFENPDNSIYLCNNFTTVLRPNKSIIFPKYLFYVLFYNHLTKKTLRFQNKTTGIINLKLENYLKSEIPLPSLEDQIRIATVLTRAEMLIAKRKESINALDELLKSTFLEMFGDINKFKHVEINDLAKSEKYSLSSGPFGSDLTSKHYTNQGVIILRGTNITSGRLNLNDIKYVSEEKALKLKRSEVRPDDIVIIAVGSSGQALKIPQCLERAIMSQNFNKITPDQTKINPTFLEFSINSKFVQNQFKKQITDTVRTFLSLTNIKKVKVLLPPLPLQDKFAQIAEKVESIKNKYQESLTELENLYASLSQRAFKGELDLSKIPVDAEIKTEPAEVKMETNIPEVEITKQFSEKELIKIIKQKSVQTFSFSELWNDMKENFVELPGYDQIKKIVFNMLERDKPFLYQEFDDKTKDADGKPIREIILRVNA